MKKFFTFILVCCLVFSSSSFVFAAATQWDTSDSQHLTGIYNSLVSTSSSGVLKALNQIYTVLTSTTSQSSMYAIAAYLYDIRDYANQIASGLNGTSGSFLEKIYNALVHTDAAGIVYSYVTDIYQKVTEIDNTVLTLGSKLTQIYNDSHKTSGSQLGSAGFFSPFGSLSEWNYNYYSTDDLIAKSSRNLSQTLARMYAAQHQGLGSNMGTVGLFYGSSLDETSVSYVSTDDLLSKSFRAISQNLTRLTTGFSDTQGITSWTDLTVTNGNPTSFYRGMSRLLSAIQTPVARLAYVHASDEEIAAREKAEANQTAVVDNFIDPNGSGSLPTSSIGSVSDMSDSFKDNFSTDASPTGLFDIFNSDHGSWFSQETANQLDTTNINNRSLKAAPSQNFDTPLLDQQIDDIYNALGVKK